MAEPACLADTNILLRLESRQEPESSIVAEALGLLRERGSVLHYTSQTLAELWNVSTRPAKVNGFGLTIQETEIKARAVESAFVLLSDSLDVHLEWRRLVLTHEVKGAKVHDARLVATMRVYGVRRLLTLNPSDFYRYPGIQFLTPRDVLTSP